jgi:6-pyruvoyltetrahydropterin/6-carboxytetrahydropterin synthase
MFRSTKKWGHERGLSCAFRQWRAASHCARVHGYAIAIELVFEATELDERNWVVDFGALKEVEAIYRSHFDHKTLVAKDDPKLDQFKAMCQEGILDLLVVEAVGCEAFARMAYDIANQWLQGSGHAPRVRLVSAQVSEHGSNSAIYLGE